MFLTPFRPLKPLPSQQTRTSLTSPQTLKPRPLSSESPTAAADFPLLVPRGDKFPRLWVSLHGVSEFACKVVLNTWAGLNIFVDF